MIRFLVFAAGTAALLWFSRQPIRQPGGHGFYRFFAWEAILGLLVMNQRAVNDSPFSIHHLASWGLMLLSIFLVFQGAVLLRNHGAANPERRRDAGLYGFERTTALVRHGLYKYIRHPMYASLLALAWGAYFEDPSWLGCIFAGLASILLLLTARADERECMHYFGAEYQAYMKQTKMFIPYIF